MQATEDVGLKRCGGCGDGEETARKDSNGNINQKRARRMRHRWVTRLRPALGLVRPPRQGAVSVGVKAQGVGRERRGAH